MAVRALEVLAEETTIVAGADAIVSGLRDVRWPARLEWLRRPGGSARVLLDAAHNPAGARALASYLEETGMSAVTLVTSVMRDKDVDWRARAAADARRARRRHPRRQPARQRRGGAGAGDRRGSAPRRLPVVAIDDPWAAVNHALGSPPAGRDRRLDLPRRAAARRPPRRRRLRTRVIFCGRTPAAAAVAMTFRLLSCLVLLVAAGVATAAAQVPGYNSKQFRIEQIDEGHWRFTGEVELENEEIKGQKFYANVVDLFTADNRVEASGNVVYETATARIAAERAVFFTRAGTGTFYTASGLAALGEKADKSMFGALEPDVYFYGEVLEKVGEDRYKISKGGFTTCVQPTPRWELVTGSASINVGDYAILRNAVMRVKDVPVFYLPIMYYPIQEDDRATGFLLPTYSQSSLQGQSLSNAFFWAISRSQDLTVLHDWYAQTGQGYGSEYRWVRSPTSVGNLRAYRLQQKAGTVDGIPLPESRSMMLSGGITQDLPFRLKGRARIDYSSNLTVNQLYSQDVFNATNGVSMWNGNVSGSWQFLNTSLTAQRTQQFFSETASRISGSMPSLTAAVSNRKIRRLPMYFALQSEASRPIYIERNGEFEIDRSMDRFDLAPMVRMPISGLHLHQPEPQRHVSHHLVQREPRPSKACRSRSRTPAATATSVPRCWDRSSAGSTRRTTSWPTGSSTSSSRPSRRSGSPRSTARRKWPRSAIPTTAWWAA